MTKILESILAMIQKNGFLAMFTGGIVEQIIVPIPSPIITMAGGALLIDQGLPIFETIFSILSKFLFLTPLAQSLAPVWFILLPILEANPFWIILVSILASPGNLLKVSKKISKKLSEMNYLF